MSEEITQVPRKQQIQLKMKELQQEFSTLNAEKKDLEEQEARAENKEKYKDYLYKVGLYGYTLYDENEIKDVEDNDREEADVGSSGLVFTGTQHKDGFCYLLMKSKEEHARLKRVLVVLEAVSHLKDPKETEREKYIKIILGEADVSATV